LYPKKFVHEGHPLEIARIIDHNIYDQERKFIFGTCSIQIAEVDANLDLSILLGNGYNVGYLVRVMFFPHEIEVYKLLTSDSIAFSIFRRNDHCCYL